MTEETRKKISISLTGKKHSLETKNKMRISHLGRQYKSMSEEGKKNISLSKIGKPGNNLGKKWKLSEEAKQNISKGHIGINIWAKDIRGENHHRYIQDRSLLKTDERKKSYDTKYKYWMLEVKKRDGWKCKIADENCKGRLEAHHILDWINYSELRYVVNNGITLCHFHHPRKREDEKRLSPYFQELIKKV